MHPLRLYALPIPLCVRNIAGCFALAAVQLWLDKAAEVHDAVVIVSLTRTCRAMRTDPLALKRTTKRYTRPLLRRENQRVAILPRRLQHGAGQESDMVDVSIVPRAAWREAQHRG